MKNNIFLIFMFSILHQLNAQEIDSLLSPSMKTLGKDSINISHQQIYRTDSLSTPKLKSQMNDTLGLKTTSKNSLFTVLADSKNGAFHIFYGSRSADPPFGWGGKLTINIKNSTGKIVYTENVMDFEGEYNNVIDLSNEEKGNYIIEITIGNEGKIKKEVFISSIAEDSSPEAEEKIEDSSLLNVFPNPTDGTFQIVYGSSTNNPPDGWGGELVISIRDPYGKTVYSETILNFEGEYNKTIDLNSQEKGLYLIEIASGKQGKTKREVLK